MVRALTMIRSVRLSAVASSFGISVVARQHLRVVLLASRRAMLHRALVATSL